MSDLINLVITTTSSFMPHLTIASHHVHTPCNLQTNKQTKKNRVQAGHCFHLFTKHQLEQLAEYQQPEMLRTPLEELVLQIKILKLGEAGAFLQKAIQAPEKEAVSNAIRCLKDLVSYYILW